MINELPAPDWMTAPPSTTLPEETLDIWRIDLDNWPLPVSPVTLLAEDEKATYERLVLAGDKNRRIRAKAALRAILAVYSGHGDPSFSFRYSRYGKPSSPNSGDPRFNLSHSGRWAVAGFTRRGDLGVDIEAMDHVPNASRLAEQFFSPQEYAGFLNWPVARRREAFFRTWTLKEAYLKAVGSGLNTALTDFTVANYPNASPKLLTPIHGKKDGKPWKLYAFLPAPGYCAALAIRLETLRLRFFDFGPEIMQ